MTSTHDGEDDDPVPPNICTVAGPPACRESFRHACDRLAGLGWLVFPPDVPHRAADAFPGNRVMRRVVRRDMIGISSLLYVCDIPQPDSDRSPPHLDKDTIGEIRYAAGRKVDVLYLSLGAWPPRAPYDWLEIENSVSKGDPAHPRTDPMLREWARAMQAGCQA